MSAINIKAEVETVIKRELIGHEKAVVIFLFRSGMANPIDIAREMLTRHLANNTTRHEAVMAERADLLKQLAAIDN